MSRETKSAKQRVKSAVKTIGNSGSLDTRKEFDTKKTGDLIPGKVKLALVTAGIYGSNLNHREKKLKKMEEQYNKWERNYQLTKGRNGQSETQAGDAFSDTFNRIMMELKQDEIRKKKERLEKAKMNHQKLCQNVTGMFQGIGRLADTTTRKSAYSQMSGKTSAVDVPIDVIDDIPSFDR